MKRWINNQNGFFIACVVIALALVGYPVVQQSQSLRTTEDTIAGNPSEPFVESDPRVELADDLPAIKKSVPITPLPKVKPASKQPILVQSTPETTQFRALPPSGNFVKIPVGQTDDRELKLDEFEYPDPSQTRPSQPPISERISSAAEDRMDDVSPSVSEAFQPGQSATSNRRAEVQFGQPEARVARGPNNSNEPTNKANKINVQSLSDFKLAAQPELGEEFHPHHPIVDKRSWLIDPQHHDFHPGPIYEGLPYDPSDQMRVYEGKTLNGTQRPLLELGRPWYQLGQLSEGYTFLGKHNPVIPQLIVFGDYRTAFASNNNVGNSDTMIASEFNMNWDLKLTSTERFAWFVAPLNDGNSNNRYELDNDRYVEEFNFDFLFGYFEGDLGALVGGFTGETLPFDLPFAVGVMPLLFQNGIWLEDQFLGVAATIPARNSPKLNISNMDITFFAGFDEITSAAFDFEDDVAKLYGVATFIEAWNGYWEIDYAYLEDRNQLRDRSYHNIGIGYTRRYGRFISNSSRIIINAGQSTDGGPGTADGVLLLSENSLITANPATIIPYFNMFVGIDRPQKAAGANVLKNTGILFESDGMTGYPTLDDTAQDTWGGALGINIMPRDFSQQLILETAFVGTLDNPANVNGSQVGFGARYQLPLSNSIILRADAMVGLQEYTENINGARLELRKKF